MAKSEKIIIRCSHDLKKRVMAEAKERSESEAVIVREALREYFELKERKHAAVVVDSSAISRLNDAPTAPLPPVKPIAYKRK